MSEVYSHAILTIAAGRAKHCDEGFVPPENADPQVQFVRSPDNPFGEIACLQGPLHRRSWALQEHELSTRIIDFGDHYVIWRCRKKLLCYSIRLRDPANSFDLGRGLVEPHLVRQLRCFDIMEGYIRPGPCPSFWRRMVEDFSTRQLTVATDKLLALSCLAVAMQRHTGSHYLVGLWKEHLKGDLVWSS
jgi:hypothetical protein